MDAKQKVVIWIGILLVAAPIMLIILRKINNNLAPTDSDAIYGGRIEKEYLSAGYMVSYLENNNATICGLVKVDKNIAITAAHCLESSDQVYLSADPSEPQLILNAIPVDVYTDPKWDSATSNHDFAVLNYENDSDIDETFANIVSPIKSCNYRVVGYGRTSDDETLGIDREKRSTVVCIERFDDDLIYIQGSGGGICMGDSGSPIYEIGTENVVGVISSVVLKNGKESPCYIDNEGVAVRADVKANFVRNVSDKIFDGTELEDDVVADQVEAIPNEIKLDSNGSESTISRILGTNQGEKILGLSVELATKLYFAIIILFAAFAVKVLVFEKSNSAGSL